MKPESETYRKTHPSWRVILPLILIVMLGLAQPGPARAAGADFYVNPSSGNDTNDCATSGTACKTIAGALGKASAGDTIHLANGTYSTSTSESFPISVAKSITISGASQADTIVSASGGRAFTLSGAGNSFTFQNMTISGGSAGSSNGGGIFASGVSAVTLTSVTLTNNSAYHGGGIYVSGGSLTLTNSTISTNTATSNGGGVYVTGGTLTTNATSFTSNIAAYGAGLYTNATTLSMTGGTLSGNNATYNGGAILYENTGSTSTISGATINGNNRAANGAGIYQNGGALQISGSTLQANAATGSGGASYLAAGTQTVATTTVASNTAPTGAGFYQAGGSLSVDKSLLSSNTASATGGGAAINSGSASFTTSTFTGNKANGTLSTNGGGAIYKTGTGSLTVTSDTIANNTAASPNAARSGFWLDTGSATLTNSLMANNNGSNNCSVTGGTLTDGGSNLDNGTSCGFAAGRSSQTISLDALAANGGATKTLALKPGNLAIDGGSCSVSTDQRGIDRPKDGDGNGIAVCDVGAFEFVLPKITLTSAALAYTEGDGWKIVDPAAALEDDAANYNTGTLTIGFGATGFPEDQLSVLDASPFTISSPYIIHNGTSVIGSFDGGVDGADLVISLNSNATPVIVQELLRKIQYEDTAINPDTTPRSINFTLQDKSSGGSTSSPVSRTVTVASKNYAPTVSNVSLTDQEDATLQFDPADFQAAFSDPDGDSLATVKITSLPAHGGLALDGAYVSINQEIPVADVELLTYSPQSNYYGSDSFGWNGSDGTTYAASNARVDIAITPVNDPPTLTTFSVTTNEDTTYSFTLAEFTSHFADVDAGDTLQMLRITALPTHGMLRLGGAAVSLDQEIPASQLSTLTYAPNSNANSDDGAESFGWNASDGQDYADSDTTTSITVTPVDDTPTLNDISDVSIAEDAAQQTVSLGGITSGASNEPQTLTVSIQANDNTGLIPGPTVTYHSPDTTGSLTFTPVADKNGTAHITVRVSDGSLTYDRSFTVTVSAVNDPPVNTVAPVVSGTSAVSQTRSTTDGTWNDTKDDPRAGTITISYQWQDATSAAGDGHADISGATSSSYSIPAAEAHKYIRVAVTATDDGYPRLGSHHGLYRLDAGSQHCPGLWADLAPGNHHG